MNDELLRIWDALGQTVLFITHDIDEAIYLSDRIAVLSRPPGGIYRVLGNELPRPRHGPTTRTSETFWSYKKALIGDIAEVTAQAPHERRGDRAPEAEEGDGAVRLGRIATGARSDGPDTLPERGDEPCDPYNPCNPYDPCPESLADSRLRPRIGEIVGLQPLHHTQEEAPR